MLLRKTIEEAYWNRQSKQKGVRAMNRRIPLCPLAVGFFAALSLVVMMATPSWGQTVTGRILGTVRDQQGAVIPNASVSAKNVGTGSQRATMTDASGGFTIDSLPAGA